MVYPQTVTGFFDNKAEAQQAVQLLLKVGFTADHINFSTPTGLPATDTRKNGPTAEERNTGRFFSSLFGTSTGNGLPKPGQDDAQEIPARSSTTVMTVQVQSALEADQAVDSLKGARKVSVSQSEE